MRSAIPVVFFALAAWFLVGARGAPAPIPERVIVDPSLLSTEPERELMQDPPEVFIGGFEQRCEACHMLFESNPTASQTLRQHEHILLGHGMNDRCYNCHALTDRDKLELHDGTLIGYDRSEELCAKCHGPTFRDWEKGVHGKTLGAWDVSSELHRRLKCTECHDPHAPAFPPMTPLPGPNTLRMGERPEFHEEPVRPNPLQRWVGRSVEHAEEPQEHE